ncbi:MAG TPA: OmpA family protein [Planctomycetes bacterium]|nr:OmpA family protein [Planctomycetota bacterium]
MSKMQNVITKTIFLLTIVVAIGLFSGCTNWQKKYDALNVEHQNLKGLYENCVTSLDTSSSEKARLGQELNKSQMTIEELQRQIRERQVSPAEATGFSGLDVAFDPSAGTITVTLPNAILFSPGKASLKQASVAELDHVLSVLRQRYHGRDIDVVGHTDSDPIRKSKWKDNWQLSAERALTVLRYMTKQGVEADRIRAVGAGQSRPVASNATSSGKAKNRRVEIVVHMR